MINLWDMLVRVSNGEAGPAQQRASEATAELQKSACLPWQNICVSERDGGWLINVGSSCETGVVEILVPKNADKAVSVIQDTRRQSQPLDFATLFSRGRYSEAAHVANAALTALDEEAEQTGLTALAGPDTQQRPKLLYNLATAYMKRGNFHRAEILYEQALDVAEHAPCFSDAERVRFFCDWGQLHYLYRCTSDEEYVEAESRFQKALALAEKLLGKEHTEYARVLTGLARLRIAQFRHAEAATLLQEALTVRERTLGPLHEDVAETLLELGRLHAYQDDNLAAEADYRRALTVREQTLGPQHPDVAEILFNLADLYYYNRQQHEDAAQLMLRALDVWQQSLGLNHPLVEREGEFIKAVLPAVSQKGVEVRQALDMEDFDDDVEF